MLSGYRAANMCKSSHPISDFVTRLLPGVVLHGVAQGVLRCHAALRLDDMALSLAATSVGMCMCSRHTKVTAFGRAPCCPATGLQTCASMDTFTGVPKSWRLKNAWCPSHVAVSGGRSGVSSAGVSEIQASCLINSEKHAHGYLVTLTMMASMHIRFHGHGVLQANSRSDVAESVLGTYGAILPCCCPVVRRTWLLTLAVTSVGLLHMFAAGTQKSQPCRLAGGRRHGGLQTCANMDKLNDIPKTLMDKNKWCSI